MQFHGKKKLCVIDHWTPGEWWQSQPATAQKDVPENWWVVLTAGWPGSDTQSGGWLAPPILDDDGDDALLVWMEYTYLVPTS